MISNSHPTTRTNPVPLTHPPAPTPHHLSFPTHQPAPLILPHAPTRTTYPSPRTNPAPLILPHAPTPFALTSPLHKPLTLQHYVNLIFPRTPLHPLHPSFAPIAPLYRKKTDSTLGRVTFLPYLPPA